MQTPKKTRIVFSFTLYLNQVRKSNNSIRKVYLFEPIYDNVFEENTRIFSSDRCGIDFDQKFYQNCVSN